MTDDAVPADSWVPEPDQYRLKRDMAVVIATAMKRQGLTQEATAETLGISVSDLVNILSGDFTGYSLPRLIEMGSTLTGIWPQDWKE
jgi:predicted XRE-type DNA-binding protein